MMEEKDDDDDDDVADDEKKKKRKSPPHWILWCIFDIWISEFLYITRVCVRACLMEMMMMMWIWMKKKL